MERWIIWFIPENKKIQLRQFHTQAETMQEAIETFKKEAYFTYKIMGVSGYNNLGVGTREEKDKAFVNNSFY